MAERFFARKVKLDFARKVKLDGATSFMEDLISNQGVVDTTITTFAPSEKWLVFTFFNDIPVVTKADGATTTYEGASAEPTWADLVEVTDGDHASGHTLAVNTSAVDMGTVGTFDVGYIATDSAGNASELFELEITIEDTTAPVITLTGTTADVEVSDAPTWTPATNMVSAIDAVDGDVSEDVVYTYKEDTSGGSVLATLELARTHLGTETNAVFVTYDVDDAESNSATQKTATFTAIADV